MKSVVCRTTLFACLSLTALLSLAAEERQTGTSISYDGVRIEYSVGGTGSPTLVFIHGWNCDRSYWTEQWSYFARQYRIVAVDLAGHGGSGDTRDDYSMRSFGHDVAAAVPGTYPVVLIGHSMGATVMLEAARLLGERVMGMVAVDSLTAVTADRLGPQEVDAQLAPMIADFEAVSRPFIIDMFSEHADAALRERIVNDMLAADPAVSIGAVRGLLEMDYPAAFADLSAPLVLINATRHPTDLEGLRTLHENSRLVEMEDAGHFLMLEQPAKFNVALERVVQSLLDASY